MAAVLGAALLCAPLAAAEDEEEDEPEEIELELKRDPAVQARAAIRRGDFRVARLVHNETDEVGHISFGEGTPGLACDGSLGEVAARDLAWSGLRAVRFARAYNAVLLAYPRYPDRDVCVAVEGEGDDSSWPDFARLQGRPLSPSASVNRAARAARPDLVRAQVAAGRPFDAYDRWYRRPLHWAARRGDLATLDMLLAAGARTDAAEPASALLLAADSGRTVAVERLLAAGASPFRCGKIDVRLSWGSTNSGSRQLCPLRQAIERGFAGPVAPLVRSALARGTDYLRNRLVEDLYKAVELGRTDVVRAFVDGAGPARERYLQPAVMRIAAYRLDRPMLRTLMALGAGNAARTPAEERLWLAAAALPRPEPLAMLIWFGRDLNYLTAADRARLEAALPTLNAAGLRPLLDRAVEQREKAWDAVLAGDLESLDAMAAAGVDFAERRGDTALSRAARRDAATVRWMLAHGARTDTYEEQRLHLGCASVSDDFGRNKHSRAQRESFVALCEEDEARLPKLNPRGGFADHALVMAVRAADPERIELLFPGSRPEAAVDAIGYLALHAPPSAGRLPLLTRLTALAAKGPRSELAYTLRDVLRKNDLDAASAMLRGFLPTGAEEIDAVLDSNSGPAARCRAEPLRLLRDHGVDLSAWRDYEGRSLFGLAARCNSAELVALAATVPGIGVNDLGPLGDTALDLAPWDKPDEEAVKALVALGARRCEELYGDESDKCRSPGIRPDPAL
ncbi:MAG TPA: ankyrin repeat domain-containing protein [Allosphingosinicella sp.]